MSIDVMSRVWKVSRQSGNLLLLLLAISDHADSDGVCWPGIPKLARKTRISERQAMRNVQALADSGEIYVESGRGRHITNRYFVTAGLNEDEIQQVLISRFDLSPEAARQTAQQLLRLQKGDTGDTFLPKAKKVTSKAKKVTSSTKNVTSKAKKRDIAMSHESSIESSKNHHNNDDDDFSPKGKESNDSGEPGESLNGDSIERQLGGNTTAESPESAPNPLTPAAERYKADFRKLEPLLPLQDSDFAKIARSTNEHHYSGLVQDAVEICRRPKYRLDGSWSILETVTRLLAKNDYTQTTGTNGKHGPRFETREQALGYCALSGIGYWVDESTGEMYDGDARLLWAPPPAEAINAQA